MLLVISTKGCHLHTWGEETNTHSTSSKLHKGCFAKEESQIDKSAKGMLLQYSGALVVRDADRNGQVTVLLA